MLQQIECSAERLGIDAKFVGLRYDMSKGMTLVDDGNGNTFDACLLLVWMRTLLKTGSRDFDRMLSSTKIN